MQNRSLPATLRKFNRHEARRIFGSYLLKLQAGFDLEAKLTTQNMYIKLPSTWAQTSWDEYGSTNDSRHLVAVADAKTSNHNRARVELGLLA